MCQNNDGLTIEHETAKVEPLNPRTYHDQVHTTT